MLEESDFYLMILERGEERAMRKAILLVGEARLGAANESIKNRLADVKDAERLARMVEKAATASSWKEILEDPIAPHQPHPESPTRRRSAQP